MRSALILGILKLIGSGCSSIVIVVGVAGVIFANQCIEPDRTTDNHVIAEPPGQCVGARTANDPVAAVVANDAVSTRRTDDTFNLERGNLRGRTIEYGARIGLIQQIEGDATGTHRVVAEIGNVEANRARLVTIVGDAITAQYLISTDGKCAGGVAGADDVVAIAAEQLILI